MNGWSPDILEGFEQTTLFLPPAADGPVEVVLVRRRTASSGEKGVLYIHGFVDYFFQTHLADFYNQRGLHFYAVDLRRHGRSLRRHQHPNSTRDLDEYLVDVAAAIRVITLLEGVERLLVNGHSTGGLVAALHAHRGYGRERVDALFLNSPFLDMNLPAWQERVVEPVVAALGRFLPGLRLPSLSPLYGESLHVDHRGEWDFNQEWKPRDPFPVYAGWFEAIHRAQAEVEAGLDVRCPCLVLHAQRSLRPSAWTGEIHQADVILDVEDIRRLAPRLGSLVEVEAIPGGIHDLVLSPPEARARTFQVLAEWMDRHFTG